MYKPVAAKTQNKKTDKTHANKYPKMLTRKQANSRTHTALTSACTYIISSSNHRNMQKTSKSSTSFAKKPIRGKTHTRGGVKYRVELPTTLSAVLPRYLYIPADVLQNFVRGSANIFLLTRLNLLEAPPCALLTRGTRRKQAFVCFSSM